VSCLITTRTVQECIINVTGRKSRGRKNTRQLVISYDLWEPPTVRHTIPTPSVDVGTSHSPTHHPYSFCRPTPIPTPSARQSLLPKPHGKTQFYTPRWPQSTITEFGYKYKGCKHAPNWQDRNFQNIINFWSWAPHGARHQDRPTDWPSVVTWHWLWCHIKSRLCSYTSNKQQSAYSSETQHVVTLPNSTNDRHGSAALGSQQAWPSRALPVHRTPPLTDRHSEQRSMGQPSPHCVQEKSSCPFQGHNSLSPETCRGSESGPLSAPKQNRETSVTI
jgi:hypothetical protein